MFVLFVLVVLVLVAAAGASGGGGGCSTHFQRLQRCRTSTNSLAPATWLPYTNHVRGVIASDVWPHARAFTLAPALSRSATTCHAVAELAVE